MSPPRLQNIVLSWAAVLAALCQIAASFDVQTIPGNASNTRVFIAQADSDAASELFIVSGLSLTMVDGGGHEDSITFSLEEGTTAIDVADVDGDGTAEIYTVAGNEIRQRSMTPQQGSEPESRLLFSRETLLSTSDGGPQPYVIVTKWEGRPTLALPDKDGLSILTLDTNQMK